MSKPTIAELSKRQNAVAAQLRYADDETRADIIETCCGDPMRVIPDSSHFGTGWLMHCPEGCGHNEPWGYEVLDADELPETEWDDYIAQFTAAMARLEEALASKKILEEAHHLADRLAFFENAVGQAGADRSYDYAVHMADPSASAEEFENEYNAHVSRMEQGLSQARTDLERFEHDHHDTLAAAGRVAPKSEQTADVMGGKEIRPSKSLADMIRDYEPHRVIEAHHPVYAHIVGWSAWWISRLLRRAPRALCSELLQADLDLPLDAPLCPICLQRNGSKRIYRM
ncbi:MULTISPECIES: hypothetical protein [Nocardia]|uniref:hypothetical protein n=1 Tax=Nocardia TaxID=1817 RepID=UPI0007A53EFA|nr:MULTISPECIES: hypothetical protein [Nocardia]NQE72676.1 hypothetical protein [Nocardia gamkensis]